MLTLAKHARTKFLRGERIKLGSPTNALDIADGVITVVRNLIDRPAAPELRGTFHMTGAGETNWAEFAASDFRDFR